MLNCAQDGGRRLHGSPVEQFVCSPPFLTYLTAAKAAAHTACAVSTRASPALVAQWLACAHSTVESLRASSASALPSQVPTATSAPVRTCETSEHQIFVASHAMHNSSSARVIRTQNTFSAMA